MFASCIHEAGHAVIGLTWRQKALDDIDMPRHNYAKASTTEEGLMRAKKAPEKSKVPRNGLKSREQRDAPVRTTIVLPGKLYERLGIASVEERVAASEIIRAAVEMYLDGREDALREAHGEQR